jgi:hypothetical protein
MSGVTGSVDGMTTTTYTARSAEDLLAVAPVVLGFRPSESLVLLTFGLDRPFHARMDLPGLSHDLAERRQELDELADSLLAPVRRHRPPAVVLLFFTDDRRSADAAWRRLRRECGVLGIRIVEAVRMGQGRYYPMLGRDRRLREVGVPLDLDSHPFTAQAVLDGMVIHGSREEMTSTVAPDRAAQARVAAIVRRDLPRQHPRRSAGELRRAGEAVIAVVAAHVEAGTVPEDPEAAWLAWMLQVIRVRDAAWSLVTPEIDRVHVAFWADVARRTPDALGAAPNALLGWAAWLSGDGALAWAALDRCSEVDPTYRMAALLRDAVENAIDPQTLACPRGWDDGLAPAH